MTLPPPLTPHQVYAPWCGHCKKLEPIYKKLAKRFKKVDSVVIAKMDGTENEHSDIEVKGFPTIMFFPAGDAKKAVPFEGGDRSLKVGGTGFRVGWRFRGMGVKGVGWAGGLKWGGG